MHSVACNEMHLCFRSAKKMHYKNVYDSNVVELLKKIGYARRIDEKCAVDIKILESSEKEEKVDNAFLIFDRIQNFVLWLQQVNILYGFRWKCCLRITDLTNVS